MRLIILRNIYLKDKHFNNHSLLEKKKKKTLKNSLLIAKPIQNSMDLILILLMTATKAFATWTFNRHDELIQSQINDDKLYLGWFEQTIRREASF